MKNILVFFAVKKSRNLREIVDERGVVPLNYFFNAFALKKMATQKMRTFVKGFFNGYATIG